MSFSSNKWFIIGIMTSLIGLSLLYAGVETLTPFIFNDYENNEDIFNSRLQTIQLIWPSFIMIIGLFAYVFWIGRSFFMFS